MKNPTVEELLDFEGNTEKVFAGIIEGMGMAAYTSDSNENLPVPRVDVVATLTESGPHERVLTTGDNAGRRIYDQHQIEVQLQYSVSSDGPGEMQQAIRQFRGAFRSLMFFPKPIHDAFEEMELYRAAPDSIRETGGIRQVDADEDAVTLQSTVNLVLFLATDRLIGSFYADGAGVEPVNDYYRRSGNNKGRPEYRSRTHRAKWSGSRWEIRKLNGGGLVYSSAQDTPAPWNAVPWVSENSEDNPAPTLFQASILELLGFAPPPNWS